MSTVKQLLEDKGCQVYSVAPDTTVYAALELMAEKNIGAVIVLQDDRVVGLFSERDYSRKVILQGKNSKTCPVGELMTRDVLYVQPEDSVEDCMSLMTDKRVRHIPVMDNGNLVGIISIGDVVRAVISRRESTIQQLERYITGSYG
jgi:CBS domain-containing protein